MLNDNNGVIRISFGGNELKGPVGACGIYCGYCKAFRLDHNRCLGCDWANKMLRKTRETHRGCVFWECAQNKEVECCFLCKEFPCETYYDSKEAVYTEQALDMLKELGETGLTFWGKSEDIEDSL